MHESWTWAAVASCSIHRMHPCQSTHCAIKVNQHNSACIHVYRKLFVVVYSVNTCHHLKICRNEFEMQTRHEVTCKDSKTNEHVLCGYLEGKKHDKKKNVQRLQSISDSQNAPNVPNAFAKRL